MKFRKIHTSSIGGVAFTRIYDGWTHERTHGQEQYQRPWPYSIVLHILPLLILNQDGQSPIPALYQYQPH